MNLNHYVQESIREHFGLVVPASSIELLGTHEYTAENRDLISAILKTGNYERFGSLAPVKDLLGEDLTIFRFTHQDGKVYYGYCYDSILLQQNPEVIEIAPQVC